MARFPQTEAEVVVLASLLVQGLGQLSTDLSAPPVPAADLQARLDAYTAANAAVVTAEGVFHEQHAAKDKAYESLVGGMKTDLKYAEAVFRDQPEKLNQLGWGPRRDGSPLDEPGEVRDITIVTEGDTWVILKWNPPVDGGAVGVYQIYRQSGTGAWEEIGISTETQHLLSNQPRGVQLSYRVHAVNKAGIGQPSATVTLVL